MVRSVFFYPYPPQCGVPSGRHFRPPSPSVFPAFPRCFAPAPASAVLPHGSSCSGSISAATAGKAGPLQSRTVHGPASAVTFSFCSCGNGRIPASQFPHSVLLFAVSSQRFVLQAYPHRPFSAQDRLTLPKVAVQLVSIHHYEQMPLIAISYSSLITICSFCSRIRRLCSF